MRIFRRVEIVLLVALWVVVCFILDVMFTQWVVNLR